MRLGTVTFFFFFKRIQFNLRKRILNCLALLCIRTMTLVRRRKEKVTEDNYFVYRDACTNFHLIIFK